MLFPRGTVPVAPDASLIRRTTSSDRRLSTRRPAGLTIIEIVVACTLLSAALVSIGILQTQVTRAQKSLNQRAQMRLAILNARELIGSWPPSQISAERIQALPIEPLDFEWPVALRWDVRVQSAPQPWSGHAIFLDLIWEDAGQTQSAGGLNFWVYIPPERAGDRDRLSGTREDQQP